jgi:hypothetical protein
VRRCGAQVVRAGEFRRRLDALAADASSAERDPRAGVKESELGEWMYYFGASPEDDE